MADDQGDLDSVSNWAAFAERLNEEVVKAGNPSLRILEKKAAKEGLSLPRASVSRLLNEKRKPRQQLVSNLLTVLGADEECREAWAATWQRLVLAEADRTGPSQVGAAPPATGSPVVDEAIVDALTDLVDTVKVVLVNLANVQTKNLDEASEELLRQLTAKARHEHLVADAAVRRQTIADEQVGQVEDELRMMQHEVERQRLDISSKSAELNELSDRAAQLAKNHITLQTEIQISETLLQKVRKELQGAEEAKVALFPETPLPLGVPFPFRPRPLTNGQAIEHPLFGRCKVRHMMQDDVRLLAQIDLQDATTDKSVWIELCWRSTDDSLPPF